MALCAAKGGGGGKAEKGGKERDLYRRCPVSTPEAHRCDKLPIGKGTAKVQKRILGSRWNEGISGRHPGTKFSLAGMQDAEGSASKR